MKDDFLKSYPRGGFVYPSTINLPGGGEVYSPGLTLRDWFAAAALANLNLQAHVSKPGAEQLARSAYELADAMLDERSVYEHERRPPCP